VKRGNLIKESFQEQFNKIKRIDEVATDADFGKWGPKVWSPGEEEHMKSTIKAWGDRDEAKYKADKAARMKKQDELISKHIKKQYNKEGTEGESVNLTEEGNNPLAEPSQLVKQIALIVEKGEELKPIALCSAKKLGNTIFEWCDASSVNGDIYQDDGGYLIVDNVGYIVEINWEGSPDVISQGYYDPGNTNGPPESWYPPEGEDTVWGFDDVNLSKVTLEYEDTKGAIVDVTEIWKAVGLESWLKETSMEENEALHNDLDEWQSENRY